MDGFYSDALVVVALPYQGLHTLLGWGYRAKVAV